MNPCHSWNWFFLALLLVRNGFPVLSLILGGLVGDWKLQAMISLVPSVCGSQTSGCICITWETGETQSF